MKITDKEERHYGQEQPDDDHEPLGLAADKPPTGPLVARDSAGARQHDYWSIYGSRIYIARVTRILGFSSDHICGKSTTLLLAFPVVFSEAVALGSTRCAPAAL